MYCMFADVLIRCCQSKTLGTVPTPILQILYTRSSNSVEPSVQMSQWSWFVYHFSTKVDVRFQCFLRTFICILLLKWLGQISKLSRSLKVFQSQILIFLPNKTMQRSSPQGSKHSLSTCSCRRYINPCVHSTQYGFL